MAGQSPCRVITLLGLHMAEHGDEGLAEGAFCKKTPQKVGEPEGYKEGVGLCPGTEKAGREGLAGQPSDPGHQGQATDGGDGLE